MIRCYHYRCSYLDFQLSLQLSSFCKRKIFWYLWCFSSICRFVFSHYCIRSFIGQKFFKFLHINNVFMIIIQYNDRKFSMFEHIIIIFTLTFSYSRSHEIQNFRITNAFPDLIWYSWENFILAPHFLCEIINSKMFLPKVWRKIHSVINVTILPNHRLSNWWQLTKISSTYNRNTTHEFIIAHNILHSVVDFCQFISSNHANFIQKYYF